MPAEDTWMTASAASRASVASKCDLPTPATPASSCEGSKTAAPRAVRMRVGRLLPLRLALSR